LSELDGLESRNLRYRATSFPRPFANVSVAMLLLPFSYGGAGDELELEELELDELELDELELDELELDELEELELEELELEELELEELELELEELDSASSTAWTSTLS